MPVTQDMLVTELQNLLRLTAFEQTIATVRRAQARTTALEAELAANVEKARERAALLSSAIREVGGVPDVVGSALGKLGAFTTTQLNQVQTLQGALLGDLTLEHQLRERTRYARTLAESLGQTSVVPVLDRLETAHTATIDWLEARLSEVGRTGTSLLRATPLQAVVTSARRVAAAPLGAAAGTVNSATALLTRLAGKAPQPLQDALVGAVKTADAALDAGISKARVVTQRAEDRAEVLVDEARETVTEAAADAVDSAKAVGAPAAEKVADTVEDVAGRAAETVTDAAETAAETVADAASSAQETVAELAEDAKEAAAELDTVDLAGTGEVAHPFGGYEKLSGERVMGHVRESEDVAELEQILAFESANKARKGVLAAVQERLTALSANA